ncbi:40S ribosomal protein S10-A [Astathelohania contejeani]|uniref:40S ribosomal protein S10-A n=1 Tax=Astathelohania contejeani TaxID=164912 RepID=A0ABQ7I1B6_9MICR|nr:40S ribosomal protein S10-A [Thelohania contejeani]
MKFTYPIYSPFKMMFIPTENILKIKKQLYKQKVVLVEDRVQGKHPEIDVDNMEVMQLMRSYISRGFVKKVFVWRHGYYSLLPEGEEFLKKDLCLEDVPTEVYEKGVVGV